MNEWLASQTKIGSSQAMEMYEKTPKDSSQRIKNLNG